MEKIQQNVTQTWQSQVVFFKTYETKMSASFMHPLGNCHKEVKNIPKEKPTDSNEGILGI